MQQKNKPFIISETGAALVSNLPGEVSVVSRPASPAQVAAGKRAWWNAIFTPSIATANGTLSNLKAAIWFELSKEEPDYTNANVNKDFRIAADPAVRNALVQDLRALGDKMTSPGKFKFSCDGRFSFQ